MALRIRVDKGFQAKILILAAFTEKRTNHIQPAQLGAIKMMDAI
jgi:hypothetical protein